MSDAFASAKCVVVKVGSSLLVDAARGTLKRAWLKTLCEDIAALKQTGAHVVLVSSGAIALGRRALKLKSGALRLEESQAAAAAGQVGLAHAYAETFAELGIVAAQILLTLDDTEERRRYLNARATMATLLGLGSVPVINENDTVATAEIRFGDNDRLAARVASMMGADRLVLLSDVDGLYTADPTRDANARHIAEVKAITPDIEAMAGKSVSGVGRGGMASKLIAARIATQAGADVIIAKGETPHPLAAITAGARATHFHAVTNAAAARKRWIAGGLKVEGTLRVDAGAARALGFGQESFAGGRFRRRRNIRTRRRRVHCRRRWARNRARPQRLFLPRCASDPGAEKRRNRRYTGLSRPRRHGPSRRHGADGGAAGDRGFATMNIRDTTNLATVMNALGTSAQGAAAVLRSASTDTKNQALTEAARAIRARTQDILAANAIDMDAARNVDLTSAMLDRLKLNEDRIGAMARGLEEIAALPDPVGRELARWTRPNGLDIARVATPIGVIGIIYESRPECDGRCRRAVPQIRQCRDPARRFGIGAFLARHPCLFVRGPARGRPARNGDPACADDRPRRRRPDARRLGRHDRSHHSARRQGPDGPRDD